MSQYQQPTRRVAYCSGNYAFIMEGVQSISLNSCWWKLFHSNILTFSYHANILIKYNFLGSEKHNKRITVSKLIRVVMYGTKNTCNDISIMSVIFNKAYIIKKQLKNHYHYTVNTSFVAMAVRLKTFPKIPKMISLIAHHMNTAD